MSRFTRDTCILFISIVTSHASSTVVTFWCWRELNRFFTDTCANLRFSPLKWFIPFTIIAFRKFKHVIFIFARWSYLAWFSSNTPRRWVFVIWTCNAWVCFIWYLTFVKVSLTRNASVFSFIWNAFRTSLTLLIHQFCSTNHNPVNLSW